MLGPLFRKELTVLARQRRYYVLRVVVGLGLLIGLWASLPHRPVRATTASLSEVGQTVLRGWTLATGAGVFLLVPMLVAGLVAGERDAQTFDILLTTCLDDREIIVGKLAGRLLLVAVTVAGSLPVLAIASWFGGFESGDVARAVLLLATIAAVSGSLAVYYSTCTTKPYVALIRTYVVLVLVWYVIPHGLPPLTRAILSPSEQAFFGLLSPATILGDGPAGLERIGIAVAVGYWLIASWLLYRSCCRLRQPVARLADPFVLRVVRAAFRRVVAVVTTFVENRRHWLGFRQFWRLELLSRYWGDVERRLGERFNPLLLRSAAANVYDPQGYVAALQALAWIAFLAAMLYVGWVLDAMAMTDRVIYTLLLQTELGVLFLFALVLATSAIVRERQSGSLDLLLLSEISAGQFVSGAFWGVLRTLWPTGLLLVVSMMLIGYTQSLAVEKLVWLLFVIALLSYLVLAWLAVSSSSSRIVEAVCFGLAMTVLMVGFPILFRTVHWSLLTDVFAARRSYSSTGYLGLVPHGFIVLGGIATMLTSFARRRPRLQISLAILVIPTVVSALEVIDRKLAIGLLLSTLILAVGLSACFGTARWLSGNARIFGVCLVTLFAWLTVEHLVISGGNYRIFPEVVWPYLTYLSWIYAIGYVGVRWDAGQFYAPLRELALSSVIAITLFVWQFDRLVGRQRR